MTKETDAIINDFMGKVLEKSRDKDGFANWFQVSRKLEDAIYELMENATEDMKEILKNAHE